MQLPDTFVSIMKTRLGDEYNEYLMSLDQPRYFGIRANTLKINPEALRMLFGIPDERVRWCPDGLYYEGSLRPSKSPYFHAGLFYIQEPSAMSTASLIDILPGDRVLDICAAPGGKSTQAGAKLRNAGILISNDISATRVKALVRNIEMAGIRNCTVINEKPSRLSGVFTDYFDKIIIDAPCSGEGMFRKDPDAVKSWTEYKPQECCALQREILYNSAGLLRNGGVMVYSTCTFAAEENEGMIDWFLDTFPDFEIIPINHKKNGLQPGKPEWVGGREELTGCGRIWPHKAKGEGHFLCLLQKKVGAGDVSTSCRKAKKAFIPALFNEFCDTFLNMEFEGHIVQRGTALYLTPEDLPDLTGLRVARSGWYLGDIRTKRFEPSQALAMGMSKANAKLVRDYSADDPELLRYLKGDSYETVEPDGWYLICVEGFPLGWGKVVHGQLKNKYAKGWRYE